MRILSVSGENLASLQGAFEIDFESEPLSRAGLFAITGPTGAGKSTILDAICLALYGTTPRLESVSGRGHDVGREDDENRLGSTDPASLLRKGTAAGSAEVRFLGRDGVRYRASWSVRRARNRASGKVQAPAVQLVNEETELPIGRTPTEVRREVERAVGLSYDQFCRSVLLAQGEFSRFLLAHEKERAELLERVTGTEIYRYLSIAAHERHASARAELANVQRELDGLEILSPEARASLEAERERLQLALDQARAHLREAADAVAWHERLAALAALEAESVGTVAAAEQGWLESAPLREALAGIDRAAPLRPIVVAADLASSTEASRVADREAAAEAARVAKVAWEEAASAVAATRCRQDEAVRRQAELAPSLVEARRLDLAIATARKEAEKAAAARVDAVSKSGLRKAELQSLRGETAAQEAIAAAAEGWLRERAGVAALASQWDRWRDQLLRLAAASAAEEEATKSAGSMALEADGLRGRLAAVTEAADRAASDLAVAEGRTRLAAEALERFPRTALRDVRETLSRTEAAARELAGIASDARGRGDEIDSFRRDGDAAAAEAARFRAEASRHEAQRDLLHAQVEEAERASRDARTALDLEERRALLREGEPCPLCGSSDHPWSSGAIAIAERVRERDERAVSLRQSHAAAGRAHAEAVAFAQGAQRRMDESRQSGSDRAARLQDLHHGWEAAWPALRRELEVTSGAPLRAPWLDAGAIADEILALVRVEGGGGSIPPGAEQALAPGGIDRARQPIPPGAAETLDTLLRLIGRLRSIVSEREASADVLEEEASSARSREAAIRSEKEAKGAEALACERRLQELASREREQRLRAEAARSEGSSLLQPLEPILDGVGDWRQSDLHGLVERLAGEVEEWLRHDQARGAAAERLSSLRPRVEAAESLVVEWEARVAEADAAVDETSRELGQLVEARSAVLGGESVELVERAQRDEREAAGTALDRARASELQASTGLAGATAMVQAAEAALAEARRERERLASERDSALSEAGLSLDEARERLSRPAAEVDGWRLRLAAMDQARHRAATLRDERTRAREAHEGSGRPALDEPTARVEAEVRKAPCSHAEEAFHDARNALRADDGARGEAAAILPRLDARKAEASKWGAIHELIGSASGDRFQLFAQSLTLEVLLAHANVHLEELAPRYRLERVPGKNLHLQVVDRHMGDDIRAANSLSGGETFLVSLALALGLSGLSSRSRVESLFIDEGFGTLDQQTLDIAVAALDALQASGRKVGVISHVPGMAERIGVQIQVQPEGSGRSSVRVVR